MKKYILIIATILGLSSCSSSYLDTIPDSSVDPQELYATTKNAKLGINGLAKLMIRQYGDQGMNGEGTIKLYFGEYSSNYFFKNLIGWASMMNLTSLPNNNNYYTSYVWYYYYKLIDNANTAILKIDDAIGTQPERDFIKAQALVFRAYSYMMLVQFFGNRWADSNNGATEAVVLRLVPSQDGLPLSTLAQAYTQIYADLDQAIELFESNPSMKRSFTYEPNINVAYATYARAAINKEDYPNAAKYAKLARQGFPLMSNSEYLSGFNLFNKEWIWGSYNAPDENLYYYSFHSNVGYNSVANMARSYPASISKLLYDQIPDTDLRKDMFLYPGDDFDLNNNTIRLDNKRDSLLILKYRTKYPDIQYNAILQPYMHFKFSVSGQPGVGELNHFRSAEMYLIEAEAQYQLKNETKAQQLLEELTVIRDPSYTCTATGPALFEEIKIYRGIELWGEGFNFFDLKRWGDARIRGSLGDKDPAKRDVFIVGLDVNIGPEEYQGWTPPTPRAETDFSDAFQ